MVLAGARLGRKGWELVNPVSLAMCGLLFSMGCWGSLVFCPNFDLFRGGAGLVRYSAPVGAF